MNDLAKALLALDAKFWNGDEAFFHEHVDTSCLVAFSTMSGVMSNGDIAATAGDGSRWRNVEVRETGFVCPTGDTAIVTYEATAVRDSGEPYKAIVSSGYVQRGDGWKLIYHSHLPIEDPQQDAALD